MLPPVFLRREKCYDRFSPAMTHFVFVSAAAAFIIQRFTDK